MIDENRGFKTLLRREGITSTEKHEYDVKYFSVRKIFFFRVKKRGMKRRFLAQHQTLVECETERVLNRVLQFKPPVFQH